MQGTAVIGLFARGIYMEQLKDGDNLYSGKMVKQ